eukprot:TRINITY_DN23639_c0_g1_i1.p1 TRINITY_DN23639_c0_g1~~TRINITY_DN23639_c0_g1_i1.p1  ORF type:complete len:1262 (-),score=208.80 TRINITY_DN23639_c0_g1_i1:135-3545(-)
MLDTAAFYGPVCEVVWRVVGHIFHTIVELKASTKFPVPEVALGQIRMLLQTNDELSRQLKQSRREYLRELVMLRERERLRSQRVQRAVQTLRDDPVIFYEPLSYVLDQTTKDFVREIVEERVRLEIRKEEPPPATPADEESDLEEADPELIRVRAENRQLRATAAREAERARRAGEAVTRAREELERVRGEAEAANFLLEQAEIAKQAAEPELNAKEGSSVSFVEEIDDRDAAAAAMNAASVDEEARTTALMIELAEAQRSVQGHMARGNSFQEQVRQLQRDREAQDLRLDALSEQLIAAESARDALMLSQERCDSAKREEASGDTDNEELRELLEHHLQVEKELRASLHALEKALDEEKAARSSEQLVKNNYHAAMTWASSGSGGEFQVAVAQDVDRRLTVETDGGEDSEHKDSSPLDDELVSASPSVEEIIFDKDLREKYDELEVSHMALQDKVGCLLDRLRNIGGEEVVTQTMMELQLETQPQPPPPRAKRANRAWMRLWNDAQRRVARLNSQRDALRGEEARHLNALRKAAATSAAFKRHQVEALSHLHRANAATSARFHDALANFHERHEGDAKLAGALTESNIGEVAGHASLCARCGGRIWSMAQRHIAMRASRAAAHEGCETLSSSAEAPMEARFGGVRSHLSGVQETSPILDSTHGSVVSKVNVDPGSLHCRPGFDDMHVRGVSVGSRERGRSPPMVPIRRGTSATSINKPSASTGAGLTMTAATAISPTALSIAASEAHADGQGEDASLTLADQSGALSIARGTLMDQAALCFRQHANNRNITVSELASFFAANIANGRIFGDFAKWLLSNHSRQSWGCDIDRDEGVSREQIQEAITTFVDGKGSDDIGTSGSAPQRNMSIVNRNDCGGEVSTSCVQVSEMFARPKEMTLVPSRSLENNTSNDIADGSTRVDADEISFSGVKAISSGGDGVSVNAGKAVTPSGALREADGQQLPRSRRHAARDGSSASLGSASGGVQTWACRDRTSSAGRSREPLREKTRSRPCTAPARGGGSSCSAEARRPMRPSSSVPSRRVSSHCNSLDEQQFFPLQQRLPATFNGGAGRPLPAIAQSREVIRQSKHLPTDTGGSCKTAFRDMSSNSTVTNSERVHRFCVTPLLSQKSVAMGVH